ncbi:MAG: zinc ribbon domain-containing protein [Roseiflexus sp.]|uniref:FmdB family zinc ribbon protein n=1 Tax=Roseiflexus sp. TaxID=2562120 RepID=UPI0025E4CD46|nr:FmdB family zinc ribbon protein [Roseiflexus sp.]MCL6539080.1 zinc ribbon domain-containing protein [Roseiflexus sp.]
MPLYTYTCPECEIEIEELRPAARADDPVECPVCHGLCTRDISSFSFRSRSAPTPVYAGPQQVARALHGPGCPCCTPRRRS